MLFVLAHVDRQFVRTIAEYKLDHLYHLVWFRIGPPCCCQRDHWLHWRRPIRQPAVVRSYIRLIVRLATSRTRWCWVCSNRSRFASSPSPLCSQWVYLWLLSARGWLATAVAERTWCACLESSGDLRRPAGLSRVCSSLSCRCPTLTGHLPDWRPRFARSVLGCNATEG